MVETKRKKFFFPKWYSGHIIDKSDPTKLKIQELKSQKIYEEVVDSQNFQNLQIFRSCTTTRTKNISLLTSFLNQVSKISISSDFE